MGQAIGHGTMNKHKGGRPASARFDCAFCGFDDCVIFWSDSLNNSGTACQQCGKFITFKRIT